MDEHPPAPPPRRRRPVVAVSGWLLFGCLFLPTLRVCGDPTAPIEFPFCYAVYLGAAAIAIAAVSRGKARHVGHVVVLGLWAVTVAAIATFAIGADIPLLGATIAIVTVPLMIIMLRRAARGSWSPCVIAGTWIAHATLATAWNALLVAARDSMWGAQLALGGSLVMLAASVVALVSEYAAAAAYQRAIAPAPIPLARVVVRGARLLDPP